MSEISSLDDVCSEIVDCLHKTAPIDESGEFFAVGTPAMRGHVINFNDARPISQSTFDAWTRKLRPQYGDLLLAREAPVGPVVRIPEAENVAPGQRTVLLRPRSDVINSRFLYFYLRAPATQAALQVKAAGSTVAHLNVADVRAFPLPGLPPLAQQAAISEVLGALDDKVAANRRALAGCVALADAHFEHMAASATLAATTYADVAVVLGGGTPKTSEVDFWGGPVRWATPTDVTNLEAPYMSSTARTLTSAGLSACASQLHPAGSVLMTSRATIGAFAIAQEPMAVNQGFIVVNAADPDLQWWLYHDMRSRVGEFVSHANGATFLELSRGNFKKLGVAVPDGEARRKFRDLVLPLHNLAAQLMRENDALVATRDELLPLLMSGRVAVRELADDLTEAVG